MDCSNCPIEQRIARLEQEFATEKEHSSKARQAIYDKLENHKTQLAVTDERYRQILNTLNELKSTVDELADNPAKHWNTLITTGITAMCSGLVGYVLSTIMK